MRRQWAVLFLLVVVRAALMISSPIHAQAATTDCKYNISAFNGMTYNPAETTFKVRGAKATILAREPYLCTNLDNATVAWTMVSGDASYDFAQIGYMTKNYGQFAFVYFWEYLKNANSAAVLSRWGSPFPGDYHEFTVSRYTSDGKIRMLLDGNLGHVNQYGDQAITPWDPTDTGVWAKPFDAEFLGEITAWGSDFPGATYGKTDWITVQEKDAHNPGQWFSEAFAGADWLTYDDAHGLTQCWGQSDWIDSSTAFQTWSDPLDHSC